MSLSRFWQRMRSSNLPVARVVREPETWAGIDKQTAEPLLATTFKSLAPMAKALYPASGVLSVESLEATMRMLTFNDNAVRFNPPTAVKLIETIPTETFRNGYEVEGAEVKPFVMPKEDDNDDE